MNLDMNGLDHSQQLQQQPVQQVHQQQQVQQAQMQSAQGAFMGAGGEGMM
jgi:hypothetical protein